MTQRILVPLDGSDLAEQAIPWADELAVALDAEVELLQVVDRLHAEDREAEIEFNRRLRVASSVAAPAEEWQTQRLESEALLSLSRARSKFPRARPIELTVSKGLAPEAIVAHAQASQAAMVVMASHGRTGLTRAVLGSIAGHVIRESGIPVFIVRRDLLMPPHAPTRVLVPLDMSVLAEAALDRLLPLARGMRWKVVLVSAADLPPQTLPVQGAAIPLGRAPEHVPAEVEDYLLRVKDELRKEGIDAEVRVETGDPVQAILHTADVARVGLIAISTHGRNGIGRWLLGSVAEAVISRSTVPVLAIRPSQVPLSVAAAFPLGSAGAAPEASNDRVIVPTLTEGQARVTRHALERLSWSARRHDQALADIKGALAALDAASEQRARVTGAPLDES
jgi:nucleotide-binding universal stress UspA family protein